MAVHAQTALSEVEVPAGGLKIVVSQQGASTTIALDGEWDLAERDAAHQAFQSALARQPDRVVFDLSRLTFMDSSGVHGVLELASLAARLKIELVVVPGSRAVRRLFDLCRLSEAVTFEGAA
jgi:anti-anti-sigma factor